MMKKTTPRKFGLNVKKAPSASKPSSSALGSVFGDTAMPTIDPGPSKNPQQHIALPTKPRSTEKAAADSQPADSSVYAYDEFYDSIQSARDHIKKKKSSDMRPRYMEKLIETAKQRQTQQEVAKERLLAKEREREGDQYGDKEVFVTSGYKEIKEERQRKVKEEEEQERAEESRKKKGMGGFYRGFLDQIERDDLSKVAEKMDGQSSEAAASGRQAEPDMGPNAMRSRPLASRDPPLPRSQPRKPSRGAPERSRGYNRPSNRDTYSQMAEQQEIERQEKQATKDKAREDTLRKSFARRNDESAVEAARQRYVERMAAQGRRVTTR